MMRTSAQTHLAIAALLTFVLLALTAVPAAAGGGLWRGRAAEDVAVRLVNCMRTGGHVTAAGKCLGRGSGQYSTFVPPLNRSHKISDRVTWPWARKSVQFYGTRRCWIGHARNGSSVDKRFAIVSLKHIANGENMGCGMYGTGKQTVTRIVRMWQSERSYGGTHWRQVKDKDFKSIGVGVGRYGRHKAQLVVNFYGKVVD